MFGISYPGFYTAMGMIDSHPALKGASPQAPIADWFIGDDIHHNGAFFLADLQLLLTFRAEARRPAARRQKPFNFKTPDGYDFFLRMGPLANSDKMHFKGEDRILERVARAPDLRRVLAGAQHPAASEERACAVMTVGGWFDAEDLFGPLEMYRETERQNPGITTCSSWARGRTAIGRAPTATSWAT